MKPYKKYAFLLLSILGLIGTWYFNLRFMLSPEAAGGMGFIEGALATLPAQSISIDITVVCIAFFIWYIPEARRLQIRHWWIFIPLTFLIALAFAFPLFLYVREKKLENTTGESMG